MPRKTKLATIKKYPKRKKRGIKSRQELSKVMWGQKGHGFIRWGWVFLGWTVDIWPVCEQNAQGFPGITNNNQDKNYEQIPFSFPLGVLATHLFKGC